MADDQKGYRNVAYVCSSPATHCTGRSTGEKNIPAKCHSTPDECLACQKRYLIGQGYKALSSRQFDPQNGGPILTLPKKTQRLKPGKTNGKYMALPLKMRGSSPPPKP